MSVLQLVMYQLTANCHGNVDFGTLHRSRFSTCPSGVVSTSGTPSTPSISPSIACKQQGKKLEVCFRFTSRLTLRHPFFALEEIQKYILFRSLCLLHHFSSRMNSVLVPRTQTNHNDHRGETYVHVYFQVALSPPDVRGSISIYT